MKVPLERYSKVVNGFTFDENKNVLPIYVDFRNSKIIVNVSFFLSFFLSFFRMWLFSNPLVKNDSPTVFRFYGYKIAYVWYTFIEKAMIVDFERNVESSIFAEFYWL